MAKRQKKIGQKRYHHPDGYLGPWLHDRWRVSELGHGHGIYVVFDKELRSLVDGSDGMTRHFGSVSAAEAYVESQSGKKTKKSSNKKVVAATGDYKSAAAMFRGLILEGSLSDDEIFAAVQAQFGLDDNRRSYVQWYRNELKKKGLTV